ncbi:hypothetical protein MMC08_007607 [Hypocenomyce scalaris]|nr:hypothetical protein [Hypocenomyce scalaris]
MKVAEVHPGKYMMRQDKTIAIVLIALTVVSIGMRSSELGVIECNAQDDSAKRPHSRIDDGSSVSGSTFLNDGGQVTLKRRKKDVDALRIKVVELQKKRDEAKRLRGEAQRKAEELRRVLEDQWATLARLQREMELEIEEDTLAAEAHLVSLHMRMPDMSIISTHLIVHKTSNTVFSTNVKILTEEDLQ